MLNTHFELEHFLFEGHDYYLRVDGLVMDCDGLVLGTVAAGGPGEYWIVKDGDGDVIAMVHQKAIGKISAAKLAIMY